jgi:alkanesulfonate monooxygenase SsuD/methylene tetrahydromethanopterin reductase-like flavin-dependent oxidoreductase (luciferase family)/predicted kinase
MIDVDIPDPALVVLVGASGSGKSHWAAERYRASEVVSSDGLRAVVGSGEADLDASVDAFGLLESIVAARLRRGLTTVVDTLGFDVERRRSWVAAAQAARLPAVAVVFETSAALCRQRNAVRDRPVPAPVLAAQLRRMADIRTELGGEGWTAVVSADSTIEASHSPGASTAAEAQRRTPVQLEFVLQLSRFEWGEDPSRWLVDMARAAEEAGFAGLALMDHLIQIPQVGRDFEPIPEPWVTLGMLAGLPGALRLGTLVSPVSFRAPGLVAKAVATLDVLSGGRAFCGLGAGWWVREHAAFGLSFPTARERVEDLETGIETIRALWAAGTRAYRGERVELPETTCYPRPLSEPQIVVGGSGPRVLSVAARLADACNLPSEIGRLDERLAVLRPLMAAAGREIEITVLDLPVVGTDREDVARRVERLRGRTSAATFARAHHAGTTTDQIGRYRLLADRGVRTVFVAPAGLRSAADLAPFAEISAAFA